MASKLKDLNIGMIGYGFMGRAHSNAYRKVNNFFPLAYRPVLKAACGNSSMREPARVYHSLGESTTSAGIKSTGRGSA